MKVQTSSRRMRTVSVPKSDPRKRPSCTAWITARGHHRRKAETSSGVQMAGKSVVMAVHILNNVISSESQRYRASARMPRAQWLDRSHNF